jgi:hypothetical protein
MQDITVCCVFNIAFVSVHSWLSFRFSLMFLSCPVLIMCLGHRDEMWLFVNISRSIPHSWLITGFVTSGEGNAYPAGSKYHSTFWFIIRRKTQFVPHIAFQNIVDKANCKQQNINKTIQHQCHQRSSTSRKVDNLQGQKSILA